jgi:hypothetical protein
MRSRTWLPLSALLFVALLWVAFSRTCADPPADALSEAPILVVAPDDPLRRRNATAPLPLQAASEAEVPPSSRTPPSEGPARSAAIAPEAASGSASRTEPASGGIEGLSAFRDSLRYSVDRDGIAAAVRSQRSAIRDCYAQWNALQPGLGGRIQVAFTIMATDAGEGVVTGAHRGDGGLEHVPLEGCILSAFSDLRFEAPTGGAIHVLYPLLLSPGDGGA